MAKLTENELRELLGILTALSAETEWVEFKENITDPDEFGKSLSAVSNSAKLRKEPYGFLVSGVRDITHEIVGTTFKPSREKVGNQAWEIYIATMLNPHLMLETFEFNAANGKNITLFRVPANPNPGPLKYKTQGYIRIGSSSTSLHQYRQHEELLWREESKVDFWDELMVSNLSPEEVVQHLYYEGFPELSSKKNLTFQEVIDFFLEEGHIINKQSLNKYAITRLGALVLARDINKFPELKPKMVRFFMYPDKNNLTTDLEETGGMGYGTGFNKLVRYIMKRLPFNEVIQSALRENIPTYPEVAIREILANALIHQDFMQIGRPTVEIFPDRIEIKNAGIPLVTPDQFINECVSRNEVLANLMKKVNICEDRGSGIDRVATLIELYQLPAYMIDKTQFKTTVTLYAPKLFQDMGRDDKVRACYLHCCLRYVQREKTTNTTVRERFKIEKRNAPIASKIISQTIEEGLIRIENPNNNSAKFMSYIPYWVAKH